MQMDTEFHPFEPWLPADAKMLMCGTFPPPKARWTMDFYYPNFINDMWRIFGIIMHFDKNYYVDLANKTFRLDAIKEMLIEHGIALSDTGREVIRTRGNASDKYLEIIKPIDLKGTLEKIPQCFSIVTTGEKAAAVIAEATGTIVPRTGEKVTVTIPGTRRQLTHWRMPSTSRAYPLPLEKKAEFYRCMLLDCHIISG